MANTFVRSKLVLNITDIDSDWLWSDTWKLHKEGVPVYSIHFIATAAADACVLRDGSITGPVVFHRIAVAVGDQVPSYFGGNIIQLALDFSEGVYTADSVIVITLDRSKM
jgi:hypothetical protein